MEGFKKFYVKVVEWKSWACMFFTATVIIYMLIAFVLGEKNVSLFTLFSLIIISSIGTFVQFLCFTDNIIKKMKYSIRAFLFVAIFLPFLAICGFAFNWFPVGNIGAWMIFVAIFLVFFAIFTICFEVYFKLTGRKYDGILGQYKKEQEQKNK